MLQFQINTKPLPKGRPRVTRSGVAFTPKRTRDYEAMIKTHCKQAMHDQEFKKTDKPVKVICEFFFGLPKMSKAKQAEALSGMAFRPKAPDIDNLIKAVLDGINGVAFEDDRQVVELACTKHYSDEGDCVYVCIRETF